MSKLLNESSNFLFSENIFSKIFNLSLPFKLRNFMHLSPIFSFGFDNGFDILQLLSRKDLTLQYTYCMTLLYLSANIIMRLLNFSNKSSNSLSVIPKHKCSMSITTLQNLRG